MLPGEQPTVPWTDAEIAAAKANARRCSRDAARLPASAAHQEGICGTPAPVLVKSIGTDPEVAINPPATMNCAMADVLAKWLRRNRAA